MIKSYQIMDHGTKIGGACRILVKGEEAYAIVVEKF
jgi:hypothetical protein